LTWRFGLLSPPSSEKGGDALFLPQAIDLLLDDHSVETNGRAESGGARRSLCGEGIIHAVASFPRRHGGWLAGWRRNDDNQPQGEKIRLLLVLPSS
jgi:hypothetical protein